MSGRPGVISSYCLPFSSVSISWEVSLTLASVLIVVLTAVLASKRLERSCNFMSANVISDSDYNKGELGLWNGCLFVLGDRRYGAGTEEHRTFKYWEAYLTSGRLSLLFYLTLPTAWRESGSDVFGHPPKWSTEH